MELLFAFFLPVVVVSNIRLIPLYTYSDLLLAELITSLVIADDRSTCYVFGPITICVLVVSVGGCAF